MNEKLIISKEQARQFAYDWYDVIVQDIKNMREKEQEENISKGVMLINKTVRVHK